MAPGSSFFAGSWWTYFAVTAVRVQTHITSPRRHEGAGVTGTVAGKHQQCSSRRQFRSSWMLQLVMVLIRGILHHVLLCRYLHGVILWS